MESILSPILKRPLAALSFKPWHLLGFGYYQAWVYLAVMSAVLYPDAAFFNETLSFTRQYYSLSLAVALTALVFLGNKFSLLQRPVPLAVSAVLSLSGTLVIALPLFLGTPSLALVVVGITLTSVGNALCVLAWGSLWTSIATNRMGMHLVVSNCFAGVLYLAITALPSLGAIVATAALPLLSIGTLLCCNDEPPRTEALPQHPPRKLIAKIVAILVLIPFVYGIARAFSSMHFAESFNASYRPVIFGITCFAFLVMVVSAAAPRERIVVRLYRLIVPLMIVGFCAYSFVAEGDRWLAFAAIGCGFYSFEGLIWLLYPQFVLKLKHSSLIVFGWSRVLFHLCGFAGVTVGYVLVERGMAQPPALNLICLGIVMLLVMTMTYLFTEHDLRKLISGTRTSDGKGDAGARAGERAVGGPYNETASGDGAERDGTLGSGPRAAGETLEHERSVAKLAADHRLSPRETEVLELLAKGRSAPFIAEEFTVSVGTVKTHIRHIYEKLGIHSKQELLDLFERD